uniref:Putative cbf1-interacting corepressor cir n=1 Tax=Rhipicephalus microplus TaxID=6941 RepID=A0A6M2CRP0_RHIMP
MGKGYNNYMCKKPFHPASRDNIKRTWMAEQRTENEKRKQEELKLQYEKEQDLYNNRSMVSKESKEKLSLNFMYEAPPGVKREHQKEDDEPEFKFEWQRKYNAPREDFAKDNKEIRDQPFGIPVRNVRCIKCHNWGHINTDRECPMFNQASTSSGGISMDPLELMKQMRDDGLQMKASALGHGFSVSQANQLLVPSDDEDRGDPEVAFLKSLSMKQKRKLLLKLNKMAKKQDAKAEKKKRSKDKKKSKKRKHKHGGKKGSSSSESSDSDVAKRRKDRKRKKHGGSGKKKAFKKGSSHESSGSSSSSDESSSSSDSSSRSSSSDGSDDPRSRKRRASEEPSTTTTDMSSSKRAKHGRKKKESKRHRHGKKASGSSDSEDSSTGDKHHKKRKKHKSSKEKKPLRGKVPLKEKTSKGISSLVDELKELLPKTGGAGSLFNDGKAQKPPGLLFSDPMKDLLPKPASSFLDDDMEEAVSRKERSSSHHLGNLFGETSSKNGSAMFSESLSDFSKSKDTSALFEESLDDLSARHVAEPPNDMPASKPLFKDTFKELVAKPSGGATAGVSIFSGDLDDLLPKGHDSSDEELRKPPSPPRASFKKELGKPQKVIDFDFNLEGLDEEDGFGGTAKSVPKVTAGGSSQLIHFDIDFENLEANSSVPNSSKEKYSPSSPTSVMKKDCGSDPEPDMMSCLLRNPSPPPPRRNSSSNSSPDL